MRTMVCNLPHKEGHRFDKLFINCRWTGALTVRRAARQPSYVHYEIIKYLVHMRDTNPLQY